MTEVTRSVPLTARYRPRTVAIGCLAVAVVLAALGWSGTWNTFSMLREPVSPWWTLVAAVPACVLLLLRERAPLTGLLLASAIFIADIATVGGIVPLLVVLELFHATTLALPAAKRRRMLGAVVVTTAFVVCATLAITGQVRETIVMGLLVGSMLGISYWYANSVAQARELVELHARRAEDAVRLAELDRASAVQGERDRMARELHDVVAGHISAVAIRSEAALGLPGETTRDREALRAVRDASLEAHATLRSMIQVLRSGEGEFRLSPDRDRLPTLVEEATASGVRARLVDEIPRDLPAPVEQAVGRIVQESLANAIRYGAGGDAEVRLTADGSWLRVEVRSLGGAQVSELRGNGMGLELLAERARALGGTFAAGPEEDGSWLVRAALPKEARP